MTKEMEVVYTSEEERMDDNFKPPSRFYIVNAMGEGVYFKTHSRAKAQDKADEIYGAGKYAVRVEIKATIR
jgi:hypothetical protein